MTSRKGYVVGFKQTVRDFMRSKTNWTAITAIATAGMGYLTGDYALPAAMGQALGGLSMLFVRDAIAGMARGDDLI